MRYTTLAAGVLTLVSSTPVLAPTASTTLPTAASTSTSQAASQLDTLSQYAYNITTGSFDNGTTNKRNGCSLSNLKIRREWYVLFSSFAGYAATYANPISSVLLCSSPFLFSVSPWQLRGPHSALHRRKHISMQCSVSRASLQELLLTWSRE